MTTWLSRAIGLAGGLLIGTSAFAQYKYVDDDGRTTYSDQPPPPTARVVSQMRLNAKASTVALPFGLQQAVQKYPVTLYTGDRCAPCDEARTYLRSRGVPFVEKTVTSDDDIALFKQQSPDGTAPVIAVGSRRAVGFTQSTVSSLLDLAGYPATSVLPNNYEMPLPTPLSPTTKAPATTIASPAPPAPARNGTASSTASAAPTPTAPPGFRF